jgi:hypothetical protein
MRDGNWRDSNRQEFQKCIERMGVHGKASLEGLVEIT